MTSEARKWLDDLDEMLAKDNTDTTRDIMAVLTALRGPDIDKVGDKGTSTIPIRRAAFPKAVIEMGGVYNTVQVGHGAGRSMSFGNDNDDYDTVTLLSEDDEDDGDNRHHFNEHIRLAAQVLGLDVKVKE